MKSVTSIRFDDAGDLLNRHAVPIFFWRASAAHPSVTPCGTLTLVSILDRPLYVTCEHVWREYSELKQRDPDVILGASLGEPFGLCGLTGLELLDESKEMDLAILHAPLAGHWASNERRFFRMSTWPPPEPQVGELVLVVGYPKCGRDYHPSVSVLETGWVSLCYPISSVSERFIVLANETNTRAAQVHGAGIEKEHLGGMSGSPAFICRDGTAHWVGVFSDGGTVFDTMLIARCHFLRADGQLDHQAIPPGFR